MQCICILLAAISVTATCQQCWSRSKFLQRVDQSWDGRSENCGPYLSELHPCWTYATSTMVRHSGSNARWQCFDCGRLSAGEPFNHYMALQETCLCLSAMLSCITRYMLNGKKFYLAAACVQLISQCMIMTFQDPLHWTLASLAATCFGWCLNIGSETTELNYLFANNNFKCLTLSSGIWRMGPAPT